MDTSRPHIVILGAGFAGLWAMRRFFEEPVEVTVIDRNNYHTFLPLLYQVGAAELEPEQIAFPIRSLIRKRSNTRYIRSEIREIDFRGRFLVCNGRQVPFDYCILGIGTTTNFFGVSGAEDLAFSLKTLDEAVVIRNHILSCFERASHCLDQAQKEKLLTFVVVGAGATGIEFAGALMELVKGPLRKDFPSLNRETRVILVEGLGRILPIMPQELGEYALKKLTRMGVEARLRTTVERISPEGIHLPGGETIPSETVLWTAGISGPSVVSRWGLPMGPGNRVLVRPSLQVQGLERVFAVGDLAYLEQEGAPLPQVAPVAVQQGRFAAENILRQIRGERSQPFVYRDRGAMVTIGRNAAVARVGSRNIRGLVAWLAWLFIHISNLIGIRNRVFVMVNWAWDYFFFERAVRLIMPSCCDSPSAARCRIRGQRSVDRAEGRMAEGQGATGLSGGNKGIGPRAPGNREEC
jgi:NADH:ubiquinone reductase (H+-translocating)